MIRGTYNFQLRFGYYLQNIVIEILRSNNTHLFDFETYNNISFSANETKTLALASGQINNNPPGTYKVLVKGRVSGGGWFEFETVGSIPNPKSFTVQNSGSITSPTVITNTSVSTTQYSATCGGEITDNGGDVNVEYGICWSENATPTDKDNIIISGERKNEFTCLIGGSGPNTDKPSIRTQTTEGLDPNKLYYFSAFARNSAYTSYGDIVGFKTLSADEILWDVPYQTQIYFRNWSCACMPTSTAMVINYFFKYNFRKVIENGEEKWLEENPSDVTFRTNGQRLYAKGAVDGQGSAEIDLFTYLKEYPKNGLFQYTGSFNSEDCDNGPCQNESYTFTKCGASDESKTPTSTDKYTGGFRSTIIPALKRYEITAEEINLTENNIDNYIEQGPIIARVLIGTSGHFLVIVGKKEENGQTIYIVNDPWGDRNINNKPKDDGKRNEYTWNNLYYGDFAILIPFQDNINPNFNRNNMFCESDLEFEYNGKGDPNPDPLYDGDGIKEDDFNYDFYKGFSYSQTETDPDNWLYYRGRLDRATKGSFLVCKTIANNNPIKTATWKMIVPKTGNYKIEVGFYADPETNSENVKYHIYSDDNYIKTSVKVDQTNGEKSGYTYWTICEQLPLYKNQELKIEVHNNTGETGKDINVDQVRAIFKEEVPESGDLYLSDNGNDNNNGKYPVGNVHGDGPKLTPEEIINIANPGDIIKCMGEFMSCFSKKALKWFWSKLISSSPVFTYAGDDQFTFYYTTFNDLDGTNDFFEINGAGNVVCYNCTFISNGVTLTDCGSIKAKVSGSGTGKLFFNVPKCAPDQTDLVLWLDPTNTDKLNGQKMDVWVDQSTTGSDAGMTNENRMPIYTYDAINKFPGVLFNYDYGSTKYGYSDILTADYHEELTTANPDKWNTDNQAKTLFVVFKTGGSVNDDGEPTPYYSDGRQVLFEAGGPLSGYNIYINNGKLCFGMWNRFERKFVAYDPPDWDNSIYPLGADAVYIAQLEYDGSDFRVFLSKDGGSQLVASSKISFQGLTKDGTDETGVGGAARTCYHDYNIGDTYSDHFGGFLGDVMLYANAFGQAAGQQVYDFLADRYKLSPFTYPAPKTIESDWKVYEFYDTEEGKAKLSTAYPNPFTNKTSFSVNIPEEQYVTITLFNSIGIKFRTIYKGNLSKGIHDFEIDGTNLTNGMYIYHISGNEINEAGRVILNK